MIIGIASGKGGTGKTTVSVNLAKVLDSPVQLLDCDVEEPNAHLFLETKLTETKEISVPIPKIDNDLCNTCGKCSKFCQYGALASLESGTMVFAELCHGCGGCSRICPENAITETNHRVGVVETLQAGKIKLVQGRLDIGAVMAPTLIRAVKTAIENKQPVILDAPPGTSCPVVTTLSNVDFVILVTEPTPFGLNDLKLAVEMVNALDIPSGVVVNRMGIGDNRVQEFCSGKDIPVLSEIPNDRRIAEAYSRGQLIVDVLPEYAENFRNIQKEVERLCDLPRCEND